MYKFILCCLLILNLAAWEMSIENKSIAQNAPAKAAQPAAKKPDPPPSAEEVQKLFQGLNALKKQMPGLSENPEVRQLQDQAAICLKAGEWIIRHQEYYDKTYPAKTLKVLKLGEERLNEITKHKTLSEMILPGKKFVWAYRSKVDQSLQPLALSLPSGYTKNKRWPLYLVLHGRDAKLNEVSFIDRHNNKEVPAEQNWIQLDVYGRTNNAYRWAGETDVFEALEFVRRLSMVDDQRIVLWGFSMGGAGAWHLGLHHPDKFVAVGAGAGFIDTYGYQKIVTPFAEPVHSLLNIYDAKACTTNLASVPFVTYAGDQDPQLLASNTMKTQADFLEVPLKNIVGKNVGHKFEPDAEKEFKKFLEENCTKGRPLPVKKSSLRFTTYTTKYNKCDWVTIEELIEPYKQSLVEGAVNQEKNLVELTTVNIQAIEVMRDLAEKITIDGDGPFLLADAAESRLPGVYFAFDGTAWKALDYDQSRELEENKQMHKHHNIQGPIDDAFTDSFVCVSPTGKAWHKSHAEWADSRLKTFAANYNKFLRADLPVVKDSEVTDEMIAQNHLVIFGDPSSNKLLEKVIKELPITWTNEKLVVNSREYTNTDNGVCLIYPNPLNKSKYVVINSGHTMTKEDFQGTNARLHPKIGDIGVIKFTAQKESFLEEVVYNDLFTTEWGWKSNEEKKVTK